MKFSLRSFCRSVVKNSFLLGFKQPFLKKLWKIKKVPQLLWIKLWQSHYKFCCLVHKNLLCQQILKTHAVSSVQPFSCVRLFATPWTTAHQASLSITNSCSFFKFMSIELMMPSNNLIPCYPLLLSVLRIRWPKYWSFSFRISPSNEYSGLIPFRIDCFALLESKGLSGVFSGTTVRKHQW